MVVDVLWKKPNEYRQRKEIGHEVLLALRNPFGVNEQFNLVPRVAAERQPWAGRRSPVGAKNVRGHAKLKVMAAIG
jgi:hypothetical protein